MSDAIKTKAAPVVQAAVLDLSEAIEGSIGRGPGEVVRSVRVFGDHYRCNWWVRDTAQGPVFLNTGRIVKSKFLKVTMNGEKLVVEDVGSTRRK
jgi:hypothetical protein